jgi:hypothetical protein
MIKKITIVLLLATTCLFGSVNAQTFCNDEFNYGVSDALNPYSVQTFPSIFEGYLFGHNAYGDIGKAEFFNNPFPGAAVNSAKLKFAVAKTNNPNATISVKVWDNTGLDGDGNPGAPGVVLRTQLVSINSIPTGGTDLVITFTPAITVTTDFFIGITYAYANGDTVALYANNDGLTTPGTSWELWGPVSFPEVWYPLSDGNNTWGVNNSLFISAELCYVCPTVTLNLSGTDNTSCVSANGTVTASASGGTSPYSYTDGATTNANGQFTGLVGGTYNITATDDMGCTATGSETINDPTNPTIVINNIQDNTACVAPYNGSMDITVSSGASPYSFQFSDGSSGVIPAPATLPVSGLAGGNYSGTITDVNGCSATESVTINDNLPAVTLTEVDNTDNTSCSAPNGAFEVSASGGAGGYTFSANGQSNATGIFTGLDGDTYTVTATGSDGCSGTLSVTVVNNTAIVTVTEDSNTDNTSCVNPNGAFEVSATGGAGGYTYSANGQSNATGVFTGLASSSYTVTATGTDGCSGTLSVSVSDNLPPVTVNLVTATDNSLCTGANGSFEVSATGGAGGYTFSANGQSNSTGVFTGLAAGAYNVTATGADGCSGTLTGIDIFDNLPVITVTEVSSSANTSCSNPNGSFEVSASGGAGGYTFSANGQSNATGIFTGLAAGTYVVTATGSDGCSGTLSVDVADSTPFITVTEISSTPNSSCSNPDGEFEVSATGGTGGFIYSAAGQSNNNGIFTGLAAGSYTVTATGTDGCSGILTVTVAGNTPVITVTISNIVDNTSCGTPNGAFTIEATGGTAPYTIDASGSLIPLDPNPSTFSPAPPGNYTGLVIDNDGCSGSFSFDIIDNAPTVTLVEQSVTPNTLCVGVNGALEVTATTGTSPYTYTLVGPGPTINQTGIFDNLPANTYTINVVDDNSCQGTIDVVVNDDSAPLTVTELSNQPNTVCVNHDGTFTVEATGGTGDYSYYDGVNFNTDGIFTGLESGVYNVTATDDNTGCTGTISVTIADNIPVITITELSNTDNTSCTTPNGAFTVEASGSVAPYIYDNGISSNNDGIFTQLPAGTYSVEVTADNGCIETLLVMVGDNTPVISVQLTASSPNTSCTSPDGSLTLDASGGTAPYTYSGAGDINNDGMFTALAGGNYDFTVTDDEGCSATVTETVTDNTPTILVSVINQTDNTSCSGGNGGFELDASGGNAPYNYAITGTSNSTGVFTGLAANNYSVTVTDDNGCSSVISVSVQDNLATITLDTAATVASSATAADGSASATASGGTAPYIYLWSNGATTDEINNVVTGTYTVTVTDANGCTASESIFVDFFVGINGVAAGVNLQVYPNPTQGNLSLSVKLSDAMPVTVELFSVLGESVFSENFGELNTLSKQFDIGNQPDGIYLMKVSYGKDSVMRRIVLNK